MEFVEQGRCDGNLLAENIEALADEASALSCRGCEDSHVCWLLALAISAGRIVSFCECEDEALAIRFGELVDGVEA